MGFVKDAWDSLTGKTSAKASKEAAGVSAASQTEALNYLKEVNLLPQQYKEQALQQLGSLYGLPGQGPTQGGPGGETIGTGGYQPMSRADFVSGLQDDPLYAGLRETGEEAILRGASATGGLRSGSANVNLARYNQDLMRSIYGERVAGLQGMAGLQTSEQQIGQGIAGIGATTAQGITAAAQAQQQGMQGTLGLGLKAAGLFI